MDKVDAGFVGDVRKGDSGNIGLGSFWDLRHLERSPFGYRWTVMGEPVACGEYDRDVGGDDQEDCQRFLQCPGDDGVVTFFGVVIVIRSRLGQVFHPSLLDLFGLFVQVWLFGFMRGVVHWSAPVVVFGCELSVCSRALGLRGVTLESGSPGAWFRCSG